MGLYRFENQNASSIRTLLVAKCLTDSESELAPNCDTPENSIPEKCDTSANNPAICCPVLAEAKTSENSAENASKKVQQVTVYENGALREKLIEVDAEVKNVHEINSTITYSQAYRDAEEDIASTSVEMETKSDTESSNGASGSSADLKMKTMKSTVSMKNMEGVCTECTQTDCEDHCNRGMYTSGSVFGYPLQSNILFSRDGSHVIEGKNPFPEEDNRQSNRKQQMDCSEKPVGSEDISDAPSTSKNSSQLPCQFPDKYLIFTRGSETFTPHQIGIKRMKSLEKVIGDKVQVMPNVEENLHGMDHQGYDTVDHVIDLHGHIIGLSLSPDDRCVFTLISHIVNAKFSA